MTRGGAAPVGFDLDNTLIESNPQVFASFTALAAESGRAIDLEAVRSRLGVKLEEELGHWFAADEIEEAAVAYRRYYLEFAAETRPLPGAHGALEAVRRAGARAIVITAKHASTVGQCCAAAGLEPDEVVPFVHGAEKAVVINRLGVVLYVGDTPADMEAAHLAGVPGIAVTTGSFSADELAEAGASVVLASLEAFPGLYRRWLIDPEELAVR